MPDVLSFFPKGRKKVVYGVDDAVYGLFLKECLQHPDHMIQYLSSLPAKQRKEMCQYIANRLAEVDPAYVAP